MAEGSVCHPFTGVNNVAELDTLCDVSIQSIELGEGVRCFVARLPTKKGSVDKVKLKALKLPK